MNDAPTNQTEETAEWMSLQEASELLGITASTLRRWGDGGRVPMKRTLGGHRRFPRAAIHALIHAPAAPAATRALSAHHGWNFDAHELARQDWHTRFTSGPLTDRMRGLGQRLLGLLIQYINRREDDARFLHEARAVGEHYGAEAHTADASLHDTVEAFLFFRSAFSQLAMPVPGMIQTTDLAEVAGLRVRLDRFMDAILLGVIAGFEQRDV